MKKQLAMHCLPGMVSHSDADAPSSWKYCCATLRCSRESIAWPMDKLVTFEDVLLGELGSMSFINSKASCTSPICMW